MSKPLGTWQGDLYLAHMALEFTKTGASLQVPKPYRRIIAPYR